MHFSVCDFALDIVQNACESGASRVGLELRETGAELAVTITDNGRGMDWDTRARALDPFRSGGAKHPGRKVGLGLPFLVQAVEAAHGRWSLESAPGRGTTVAFSFPTADIDSPPTGDIPGLFLAALCLPGAPDLDMGIVRTRLSAHGETFGYRLDKRELSEAAGGLERASSLAIIKEYLGSQEKEMERWPE